jgi:hypothetical protein
MPHGRLLLLDYVTKAIGRGLRWLWRRYVRKR